MRDPKTATARTSRMAIWVFRFLAVAIAVTWAVSLARGQLKVDGTSKRFTIQLADGVVAASWPTGSRAAPSNLRAYGVSPTFNIIPRGLVGPPTYGLILPKLRSSAPLVPTISFIFLPLWLPLLVALTPIFIVSVRNRRRIPAGHCQKCRYDLTGNTSGVCPECGLRVTPVPQNLRNSAANSG